MTSCRASLLLHHPWQGRQYLHIMLGKLLTKQKLEPGFPRLMQSFHYYDQLTTVGKPLCIIRYSIKRCWYSIAKYSSNMRTCVCMETILAMVLSNRQAQGSQHSTAVLGVTGSRNFAQHPSLHMSTHAVTYCMTLGTEYMTVHASLCMDIMYARPLLTFLCRAVGLGASGRLYVGVNLEFARLPINNSVHAEQFLVANALHHGEQAITKIAVSAAPCGHCRQFYSELCCAVGRAHLVTWQLCCCFHQLCIYCQYTCFVHMEFAESDRASRIKHLQPCWLGILFQGMIANCILQGADPHPLHVGMGDNCVQCCAMCTFLYNVAHSHYYMHTFQYSSQQPLPLPSNPRMCWSSAPMWHLGNHVVEGELPHEVSLRC